MALGDADRLYLVTTDGGDGKACDWADWAEPRFVGPDGEKTKRLTDLDWVRADAGWGKTRVGKNANGGPLRIAGEAVDYGIGTHAPSVIVYKVPDGFTRFRARAGLDNGGTNQNDGRSTSVRFLVFTEDPPDSLLQPSGGGSGGNYPPKASLRRLTVHEDLQAQLFASEPMLRSPSNIDIDHRGRVWVCEIVNYRGNAQRDAGDRILVLEDTDGDGSADERTVFYQGTDINTPHGICVLPDPDSEATRAIVSTATAKPSPRVLVLTDKDGDLRADETKVLFKGIGGSQHDHSIHALTFGPDGRFYFNMGNAGHRLKNAAGDLVVDMAGHKVREKGTPYREGMVFRARIDPAKPSYSRFQTLAWNFRNNWMVTPDSFGTMWQSDNDDDGNRGVRINYVMPYGNYGYRDEITGAGWQKPRTGMAEDIPTRHWHQNDPGVVPNLLQTGAGSPTGITVYEGDLLPKVFQGEMIHCDAGPRVVRAYPVEKDGAGYTAKKVDILRGARDKWFRPADVKVAPDGSLLIADWYDPGVGGHNAGSLKTGRIYRVAPKGHDRYTTPSFDFSSAKGAVEALKSPTYAVRYMAWTTLHAMGEDAEPALTRLWRSDNPRYRARALWLLGKIPGRGKHWVREAIAASNPDLRVTGIRLARQIGMDVLPVVRKLTDDPSPQVRRSCAISLRHNEASEAADLWAALATRHDGEDRWYLEALGIGADNQWDRFFAAWLGRVGEDWNTAAGRDIVWRSRADRTPEYLAKILRDPSVPYEELPRYFRAFHFQQGSHQKIFEKLAFETDFDSKKRATFVRAEAMKRLESLDVEKGTAPEKVVEKVLDAKKGTPAYLRIVRTMGVADRTGEILDTALSRPDTKFARDAVRLLLSKGQTKAIEKTLRGDDADRSLTLIALLGATRHEKAVTLLTTVATGGKDVKRRRAAVEALAKSKAGARRLVDAAKDDALGEDVRFVAASALAQAPWESVRKAAGDHLPMPKVQGGRKLPPVRKLVRRSGDPTEGKKVLKKATCLTCHKVRGRGAEFGPALSEIGTKLSKKALYNAILRPDDGISQGYETWRVTLEDGTERLGLIISETDERVTLKLPGGVTVEHDKDNIANKTQQAVSMMPKGLQRLMTTEELVDLVAYLASLRKS